MIIVSQDKELIINLNNVIGIQKDGKRIGAVFVNGDSLTLAEYRTEERAKEVLQEIIEAIVTSKKASEAGGLFGFSIIPSDTYYQMPEA